MCFLGIIDSKRPVDIKNEQKPAETYTEAKLETDNSTATHEKVSLSSSMLFAS